MNEQDILAFLPTVQVPVGRPTYTGSTNSVRWMTISCPFAPWTHQKRTDNNPSFGITINPDGRSYYKCLSCGLKGSLPAMATRLGGYRKKDYSKQRRWAEQVEMQAAIARPVPDWEETVDATDHAEARTAKGDRYNRLQQYPRIGRHPYLWQRGIYWPTPYTLDLRYDERQERILFPVYGHDGSLAGFTGRDALGGTATGRSERPKVKDYHGLRKREVFLGLPPSTRNRLLRVGAEGTSGAASTCSMARRHDRALLWRRLRQRQIIVEGLFDYANLVQAGFPATRAILGTALTPEKIDILVSEGEPVYFFMDNDIAGWQALFGTFGPDGDLEQEQAWAYQLYQEIPVWIVPYAQSLAGEDPASLSRYQIQEAVSSAWLFTGKAPLTAFGEPTFSHPSAVY